MGGETDDLKGKKEQYATGRKINLKQFRKQKILEGMLPGSEKVEEHPRGEKKKTGGSRHTQPNERNRRSKRANDRVACNSVGTDFQITRQKELSRTEKK